MHEKIFRNIFGSKKEKKTTEKVIEETVETKLDEITRPNGLTWKAWDDVYSGRWKYLGSMKYILTWKDIKIVYDDLNGEEKENFIYNFTKPINDETIQIEGWWKITLEDKIYTDGSNEYLWIAKTFLNDGENIFVGYEKDDNEYGYIITKNVNTWPEHKEPEHKEPEHKEPEHKEPEHQQKPYAPDEERTWLNENLIGFTDERGLHFDLGQPVVEINGDKREYVGKITGFNWGNTVWARCGIYTEKKNASSDKRPVNIICFEHATAEEIDANKDMFA